MTVIAATRRRKRSRGSCCPRLGLFLDEYGRFGLSLGPRFDDFLVEGCCVAFVFFFDGCGFGNSSGLNLGEGESDGLAALSEKAKREKSVRGGSSKYSGFGSDASNGNNYGNATIPSPNTNMTRGANGNRNGNGNVNVNVTAQNQNDAAPLPGESDAQYMQRQMRIREEAKAKAAASANKTTTTQRTMTPSKPAVAKMKVDSDDDFFSSFGA